MSKADKMFEKLGYIKIEKPEQLDDIFNDFYGREDTVYQKMHDGEITMRLYFIDKNYGFSHDKYHCVEHGVDLHVAITEKLKELGLL